MTTYERLRQKCSVTIDIPFIKSFYVRCGYNATGVYTVKKDSIILDLFYPITYRDTQDREVIHTVLTDKKITVSCYKDPYKGLYLALSQALYERDGLIKIRETGIAIEKKWIKLVSFPNVKDVFFNTNQSRGKGHVTTFELDWSGNLISDTHKEDSLLIKDNLSKRRKAMALSTKKNRNAVAEFSYLKGEDRLKDFNIANLWYLRNTAQRTELLQLFGVEKVLANLESKVLERANYGTNIYELIEFQIPNSDTNLSPINALYLKMTNPSTQDICIEGIPPQDHWTWDDRTSKLTIQKALAWRNGDRDDTYTVPNVLT